MAKRQWATLQLNVGRVFTPAAPIDDIALFAGRREQIHMLVAALQEKGCHAVIYGERGVGKTSLANTIRDRLGLADIAVCKVSCDTQDDFDSIWRKALKQIEIPVSEEQIGLVPRKGTNLINMGTLLSTDQKLSPGLVYGLLQQMVPFLVIVIIDEFDRVKDANARRLLADTVKVFSDNVLDVKLTIVGVASDVSSLIGEHQSIERSIRQIHLPRMSTAELAEIVDKGLKQLRMRIDDSVKKKTITLSQGFPHYTHLLVGYAAKAAIEEKRDLLQQADLDKAVALAVSTASESIRSAYQKATMGAKKTLFREVLLACAVAPTDEFGTFRASDLEGPLTKITRRRHTVQQFAYHLGKLCSEERGRVLERLGEEKRHRYRFSNPLLKPYVLLHAHSTGLGQRVLKEKP